MGIPEGARKPFTLVTALAIAGALATPAMAGKQKPGLAGFPEPVDPQSWVLPQDMTWNDYKPLPGLNWLDPKNAPPKKLRAALIVADYPDRPFLISQANGSDPAGNPQSGGSVPQAEVGAFYRDFLNKPQALNHNHTINEYWLEDSYGQLGIDMEAFGPYTMTRNEYEYGMAEYNQDSVCPSGHTCDGDFDTDLLAASAADVESAQVTQGKDFDFRFMLHAGYDESGVWQELGEMRFPVRDMVTEEFGNPDPTKPNWAPTRYVPWTSFYAARGIWSHATPGVMATEGENDGASVYAHEFSHILGVLDNYGNSFASPPQRDYSGPWDMMSRGSFNGPGGNHNRWEVPPTLGASMGSHHMLRNKLGMGFLKPAEVMNLDRDALALNGPAFADVWAREIPVGSSFSRSGLHGLYINLTSGDNAPACDPDTEWRCDLGPYQNYTVEVVDRMGSDSFTPDHGVLIAKNQPPRADAAPFNWVIDSHPDDINKLDFVKADGTSVPIGKGDYRQLSDALFHAGTGPGVVSEFEDTPNRLHFYVLGAKRDAEGVLSYRVAVRSLDGGGSSARGVSLASGSAQPASAGRVAVQTFRVTNTGEGEDLIRLKAEAPAGWDTAVKSNVLDVPAGETVEVPVYVRIPSTAKKPAVLKLTATSETDSAKSASSSATITPAR
jgi:M6 family metalloprotease-like protein